MLFIKEKYILAFEIEDGYIKYAILSYKNDKNLLIKLGKKEFNPNDPRDGYKALKDIVNHYKKSKPQIILCISRRYFTVRNMKIPSFEELEIRNILELQATRQIPYAKEEIVTDFKIIEKFSDGFSSVFFAIAHQDVIKKRLDLFYQNGLDVDVVTISTDSLWSRFLLYDTSAMKMPYAVIDLDSANAEIIIVGENNFEFSRSFSYKLDNLDKFVDEVRLTFTTYSSEKESKVGSIIVTGQEEDLEAIIDAIKKGIDIDVKKVSQFENLSLSVEITKDIESAQGVSFNAIMGCLFNPNALTLNFLPKDILFGRQMHSLRRNFIIFASLLLATIISFSSVIYFKIREKSEVLNGIESRIKSLEPEVTKLDKISKNLSIVKNQLNLRGSSIDIIREVYKIMPAGIYLTALNYEEGKSVVLKGNASTLSDVLRLVTSLESSDYFESVKLKYVTNRRIRGRDMTDFEINGPLTIINHSE